MARFNGPGDRYPGGDGPLGEPYILDYFRIKETSKVLSPPYYPNLTATSNGVISQNVRIMRESLRDDTLEHQAGIVDHEGNRTGDIYGDIAFIHRKSGLIMAIGDLILMSNVSDESLERATRMGFEVTERIDESRSFEMLPLDDGSPELELKAQRVLDLSVAHCNS